MDGSGTLVGVWHGQGGNLCCCWLCWRLSGLLLWVLNCAVVRAERSGSVAAQRMQQQDVIMCPQTEQKHGCLQLAPFDALVYRFTGQQQVTAADTTS
jgi:hypothetical protein